MSYLRSSSALWLVLLATPAFVQAQSIPLPSVPEVSPKEGADTGKPADAVSEDLPRGLRIGKAPTPKTKSSREALADALQDLKTQESADFQECFALDQSFRAVRDNPALFTVEVRYRGECFGRQVQGTRWRTLSVPDGTDYNVEKLFPGMRTTAGMLAPELKKFARPHETSEPDLLCQGGAADLDEDSPVELTLAKTGVLVSKASAVSDAACASGVLIPFTALTPYLEPTEALRVKWPTPRK